VTPTWVVILVGLFSGVAGSALTAWLSNSYQRAAELRSHRLDAADGFSTGTIAALESLRNAASEVLKDEAPLDDPATSWWRADIKKCIERANDARSDLLAKQARVHLLFGDESNAGFSATGVTAQLTTMMMALEHRPDSLRDHDEFSRYSRSFDSTREQHGEFNRDVLTVLQESWWNPAPVKGR